MLSVIPEVNRKKLSEILAEVSMETGVSVEDLRSTSKRALFVRARSFFAQRAREHGYALIDIGETIARAHTTIMALLDKTTPDREGSTVAHGAASVPFPVQKGEAMDKATLRKHVGNLSKEERRELVKEIADQGTKEDRDNLAEIFSELERGRVADVPKDAAGGKVDKDLPATQEKAKSWLDTL